MTIGNGIVVTSFEGVLGYNSGSTGVGTVSGVGSTWTATTAGMLIGLFGAGTLTIANGGAVTSSSAGVAIGCYTGSAGTIVVDGAGSTLTTNDLGVGGALP